MKPNKPRPWLRRGFLALLALTLLVIAAHRPLLRLAVDWTGRHYAVKNGYTLEWQVSGSIVSDVSLGDVRLAGPANGVIRQFECSHALLDFNLWTVLTKGVAKGLRGITLADASMEVDARPRDLRPRKTAAPLPDAWLRRLDLRNINARIITGDGDVMLHGLTLLLDETKTGTLEFDELAVAATGLRLTDVHGKTEQKARTVILTDLALAPDISVPRLVLDLQYLPKGSLPFELSAHSGKATIESSGRVDNITGSASLDLTFALSHLAHADVARWVKLPTNTSWLVESAEVRVKGSLAEPRKLDATVSLDASDIRAANLRFDSLSGHATLTNGALNIESLALRSGPNTLEATANAMLPPAWNDMAQLSADVQWQLSAPQLARIVENFAGNLQGTGSASIKQGQLGGAQASLHGTQLKFFETPVASLNLEIMSDAGTVRVKSLDIHLDDQNSAALSGDVNLADRQHAAFSWSANIGNLASIANSAGMKDAPPSARKVTASGTVNFDVADVMEGKLNKITSKGTAELDDFAWQQRRIEKASLEFLLHDGQADISKLDLRLDADSIISITGGVRLVGRQAVNLRWQADMLSMAGIAPWLGVKDMPLPSAGLFTSRGKASGALADLREQNYKDLTADGTAGMTGVVWQNGRLDFAELDFSSRDSRVDVKKLEVRLNDRNKLTATGHAMLDKSGEFDAEINGTLDQLADFSGWMELAGKPRITSGRASVAWKGSGKIALREITGAGSLNVSDLKLEGRKDVFALALETSHAGRRAETTKFQASAGKLRAEASITITDTDLTIPKLVLFCGETRLIDGSAEVPLALAQTPRRALPLDGKRPMKVHLHMARMDVKNLFAVIGQKPPVTGFAAIDLDVSGTLSELSGKLSATLSDARAEATKGKLEPALVQLDATLAQRVLTIKASAKMEPLQTLKADAELPFDVEKIAANPSSLLDAPVTARITLPNSNLSVVRSFVPALASIDGTASVDVRLSGPLRKPEWQGAFRADAPRAAMTNSDMDIRDVKVRATFSGQRLTFEDASASVSGGQMRVGGTMDLASVTDPALNLRLDMQQVLVVRNDAMSMRTDGSLTITGAWSKADVAGRLEVVRGRIFKEIEFLPLSLPDQLPPPPALVRNKAAPSLPPPFGPWNLNVDVVTRDPIRLLGNVLNGSATADFHLSGTGAVPVLEGKISQQGARVQLPFSKLELSRGDVIYTKEEPFVPQLDLQGDSVVGNYQVIVNATGSAAKPTLRFTSSPPLAEPEIASLLATGTTAGDGQTAGGVAANRVAFLVLSKAYRRLFNKTAPTRQDVQPGRASFSLNPLSSGSSLGNISGTFEITPNWQAEIALGERGVRGMISYLVRFR